MLVCSVCDHLDHCIVTATCAHKPEENQVLLQTDRSEARTRFICMQRREGERERGLCEAVS